MWENEQELSRAMRSEVDGPAPAPTTELGEVLRQGRRRVLARRAGAVAGLLAVVGGVGFGTAALRGTTGASTDPADGPAVTTTAAAPDPGWSTADLPPRTPYGTWQPASSAPPPTGRSIVAIPKCGFEGDPLNGLGRVPPTPALLAAWREAVVEVAAPARVSEVHEQVLTANERESPNEVDDYQHWLDITDAGGAGGVWLSVGAFEGDPLKAADDQAFPRGNCAPPRRTVLPDGTVVQIYPMTAAEPFQSLGQALRIYRPSGQVLELEARNFSSADFRFLPDQNAFDRFGAGRATLPLTEEQLARIGLAIASAG